MWKHQHYFSKSIKILLKKTWFIPCVKENVAHQEKTPHARKNYIHYEQKATPANIRPFL